MQGCKPLGDESKSFKMEAESVFQNIKVKADTAAEKVEDAISGVLDWFQPLKEKSSHWLSAQKWEDTFCTAVLPSLMKRSIFILKIL